MLSKHTCSECTECVSMQVVTCQWVVVIQLLEFQNPMNIETRIAGNGNIEYCCCDVGSSCASQSIFYMNDYDCGNRCDTFFVVSLYDGNSELSSISTIKEAILNSPPHSLYVGYTLPFTLDELTASVSYNTKFHNVYVQQYSKMHELVLFLITAQLNIAIEMSDQHGDGEGSDLIDMFHVPVNSSNCNKAIQLDGELGVASILFKYELSCANLSTCQPVPNTSLADCSKT